MKYINPSLIQGAAVLLGLGYEAAKRYLKKNKKAPALITQKLNKMKGIDFMASVGATVAPLRTMGGDIPTGTLDSGPVNTFNGPVINNYAGRKRFGKPRTTGLTYGRLKREVALNQNKVGYRFQSITKYDNAGVCSIPLCITATGGYAGGRQGQDTDKFVAAYSIIYFPFYVMNLTSMPSGVTTIVPGEGGIGQKVNGDSLPFYQLYKNVSTGTYGWRACAGMNNKSASNSALGLQISGQSNGNTTAQSAYNWSVEKTDMAALGHTNGLYNRCTQWEHLSSTMKIIVNGTNKRPTTIRCGVISFADENVGPQRQYFPNVEGNPTYSFDNQTTDANVLKSITMNWDQYLNTKYNHPLLSIKTISHKKLFNIHAFDKFVIGNDVSYNADTNSIAVRKDYTIGSQGFIKGLTESAYTAANTSAIMDTNMQNQSVDAAMLNRTIAFSTTTNGNVGLTTPSAGGDPVFTVNGLKNLQGGAGFPVITAANTSSLFCHRKRDRWFFIQSDYFMPSGIASGNPAVVAGGDGTIFMKDVGTPGTDAAYLMNCYPPSASTTTLTGIPIPLPPSFDFVCQSVFLQKSYPDSNQY